MFGSAQWRPSLYRRKRQAMSTCNRLHNYNQPQQFHPVLAKCMNRTPFTQGDFDIVGIERAGKWIPFLGPCQGYNNGRSSQDWWDFLFLSLRTLIHGVEVMTWLIIFFYTGIDTSPAADASWKFQNHIPKGYPEGLLRTGFQFLFHIAARYLCSSLAMVRFFSSSDISRKCLCRNPHFFLSAGGEKRQGKTRHRGEWKITNKFSSVIFLILHDFNSTDGWRGLGLNLLKFWFMRVRDSGRRDNRFFFPIP